jgi:hypothetical protein
MPRKQRIEIVRLYVVENYNECVVRSWVNQTLRDRGYEQDGEFVFEQQPLLFSAGIDLTARVPVKPI